jgi:hypothetical protein
MAQDAHQHQRDRLGEVQGLLGRLQDHGGVAQIGVDVVGRAVAAAGGEQRSGGGQDHLVVVDVEDAGLRRDLLGDLAGIVGGRQAGADVEELADLRFTSQKPYRADQKLPRPAGASTIPGNTSTNWLPAAQSTG